MYKLLLVTDQQEIADAFNAVKEWELMGFRVPRVVATVHGAVASLRMNHADAVAIALPAQEEAALLDHLMAFYPFMPVSRASANTVMIQSDLTELRRLLNRTHADFSNDDFAEGDMMQLCRHEFFRALLDNRIAEPTDVKRYMRLLRSRMDADKPCVVIELAMMGDKDYFHGRWHYGPERLEVALRNFFGVELSGMRMLVSVLPDDRIYLLACPMLGAAGSESMTGAVSGHAQACITHVREYLDLDLSINNVRILPAITALAKNGQQKGGNGNGAF